MIREGFCNCLLTSRPSHLWACHTLHTGLSLNRQDLRRRNSLVYDWVARRGARLVITMGGGYSRPIEPSVQAHSDVYTAAARRLLDEPHDD